MMNGVLYALQFIGGALLIVLVAAMVLLLIILLVPIRYTGTFSIHDPEPHDDAAWADLQERAAGQFRLSWFGPLVKAMVCYPAEQIIDVRVAGIHMDVMSMVHKGSTGERPDGSAGDGMPRPGFYDKMKRTYRKADYYWRVLRKEETTCSIDRLRDLMISVVRRILPTYWHITGTVGLGDPAATARILEIQGMLYPFTADHIGIEPVFQQYQMDLVGSMRGRIRLIHLVTALITAAADRRIRLTVRRLKNADKSIAAHYRKTDEAARRPESA